MQNAKPLFPELDAALVSYVKERKAKYVSMTSKVLKHTSSSFLIPRK